MYCLKANRNLWFFFNLIKKTFGFPKRVLRMQTYYKTYYSEKRISFITIQIEDMEMLELRKSRLENAVVKINKEGVLNDLLIFYYNFLKIVFGYIHVSNIYNKTFKVLQLRVNVSSDKVYYFYKDIYITIYDNKLFINVSEIPYEYIITFTSRNEFIFMELFATTKVVDKKLKFILSDKKISVILRFMDSNKASIFCKLLRQNMYYHIKYNKIDETVIDYFVELEKKETIIPEPPVSQPTTESDSEPETE